MHRHSVWNTERGSVFVDSWTLSHDAEKEIYHAKSGKKNGTFMPLRQMPNANKDIQYEIWMDTLARKVYIEP